MERIVRIPHTHAILVCASQKALILVNDGSVAQPELIVEEHFEIERDEEAGQSDRPGRRFDGGAGATSHRQRSATERQSKDPFGGVVLVAPPTFLGILRNRMGEDLSKLVVEEIAKDLAEMPLPKIEKVLLESISA